MKHKWTLVTYSSLLVVSLILYLAETALHILAAVHIYTDHQYVWFSLQSGLLLVPLVTAQFVSIYQSWEMFQWVYGRLLWCVMHVLQLAIPAR